MSLCVCVQFCSCKACCTRLCHDIPRYSTIAFTIIIILFLLLLMSRATAGHEIKNEVRLAFLHSPSFASISWPAVTFLSKNDPRSVQDLTSLSIALVTSLVNALKNKIYIKIYIKKEDISLVEFMYREDVSLVEFMYLVFTRMPGESYRRRFRALLYSCYVFRALINSLLCWLLRMPVGYD